MNEIKKYEKLTVILLKDWDSLFTTMGVNEISERLNKSDFLVVDWVGFGKYEVKKFFEYNPSEIDCYILSFDKKTQEIIRTREKEKFEKTWKKLESIEEVKNYLISKNIINE